VLVQFFDRCTILEKFYLGVHKYQMVEHRWFKWFDKKFYHLEVRLENTTKKLRLCKRACFEESHFSFTKKQNFKRKSNVRRQTEPGCQQKDKKTHTKTERQKDNNNTKQQTKLQRKRKETNGTIPDCGKGVPLDLRMNKSWRSFLSLSLSLSLSVSLSLCLCLYLCISID
jgi:hypothetical protein